MKEPNFFTIIPRNQQFFRLSAPVAAYAYFHGHCLNLLTGLREEVAFAQWMDSLNVPYAQIIDEKRVLHFFYEAGFVFEDMGPLLTGEQLLALDIRYSQIDTISLSDHTLDLKLKQVSAPQMPEYEEKFNVGYAHLKKGNCYQFNLTGEYRYQFSPEAAPMDFINLLWKNSVGIGEQAHATYVPLLGKLYLSNSPECLFEIKAGILTSRPIKGTMLRQSDDPVAIERLWQTLSSDEKSQAELYMITDLIRNDLNRIDLPLAVVEKKKAMMIVPKLLHQYSQVTLKLKQKISLRQIMENLFPGGSITGAPKKRVMQLLLELEGRSRGFYCGSSVIFWDQKISTSINIRSCEIDFQAHWLSYQSGGGITLLSQAEEEFLEMSYKHDSFIERLNP